MTDRLYYHDSFLYDFDAEVREVADSPRPALILDRTAFYPTSGGQVFDTGWIVFQNSEPSDSAGANRVRVSEVAETEDGRVGHYFGAPPHDLSSERLQPGTRVHAQVDADRRRDHM